VSERAPSPTTSEAIPSLTTLFRPVGPAELALIIESGNREFPPRLSDQPIFYPVLNEEYAIQIARDWNVKASGAGFVTRFQVSSLFVARYPVRRVGASMHTELWVPAEELPEFNAHIIGRIEVIREFRPHGEVEIGSSATRPALAAEERNEPIVNGNSSRRAPS
jgi:hypothetical protein